MESKKVCFYCNKVFSNSSSRRRHLRNIHHETTEDSRKSHILCPLCKIGLFNTYDSLNKHLEEHHEVSVNEVNINFASREEYNTWTKAQKLEVNYTMARSNTTSDYKEIFYNCNRSNIYGRESKAKIRTEKAEGSIKIFGVCPSRLQIKFFNNGLVSVKHFTTHIGHDEEIRCQHLSNMEKEDIVKKLQLGVSVDRILEDARKIENTKIGRINLLNRQDIDYLMRKNGIKKRRHEDDMIAVDKRNREGRATNSVADEVLMMLDKKPSEIQTNYDEEIQQFINEKQKDQEITTTETEEEKVRRLGNEELLNFMNGLNYEDYRKTLTRILKIKEEFKIKSVKKKMIKQE